MVLIQYSKRNDTLSIVLSKHSKAFAFRNIILFKMT